MMNKEQKHCWSKTEINNMILYLISRFLSNFGQSLFNFAVSLYILSVSGSGTSFAISLVVGTLPKLIFSVQAGIISDKIGKRKVIIFSDIIAGIFLIMLFIIMKFVIIGIGSLYILNFLLGSCSSVFNVAMNGAISNIVEKNKLTLINSWTILVSSIASILGPIIGGLIYKTFYTFILLNAICYFSAAFIELFISFSFNIQESDNYVAETKSSMKDALIFLKENQSIAVTIGFASIFNLLLAFGYSVPMPYIINNYLHMSSFQYGALTSSNTLGTLLSALIQSLIPEKKHLRERFLSSVLKISVVFILLGLISSPIIKTNNIVKFNFYIILYMCFGFILVLINVPLKVVLQKSIPNNIRGKSLGLMYSVMAVSTPIGQISAGFLIDRINSYYFPIIAGVLIFICYIFMLTNKKMKGI